MKCRKSQKLVSKTNEDEADHDSVFGQVIKTYGSDGESNLSQESSISPRPKEAAIMKANGKTKANKGSATDPQSVYARVNNLNQNAHLFIIYYFFFSECKTNQHNCFSLFSRREENGLMNG